MLRLEDTDKNREVEGSAEHLIASLKALGLQYDEGPDIGGQYGPYIQSQRLESYKQWAQKLIDAGRAYADPYSPAEVQAFREEAAKAKRPFLYRDHRPENPPAWDGSKPLRFKSDPKPYAWHDEVMGDLATGPEVIDDFILMKSDGYPTYNFAHIVDDAEMEITHIIRGQEFISSMPNYLNLYEALGYDMASSATTDAKHERSARASGDGSEAANSLRSELEGRALPDVMAKHEAGAELQGEEQAVELISAAQWRGKPLLPKFATMPHILNEQGNKKLGKRDGAKDVLDYIRDGYLPEALVSFIATLGWNDGTTQEVFTMDELIEKFSLERVGRSGARFDEKRLLWVNGHFIRELSLDELYKRTLEDDGVAAPAPARSAGGERSEPGEEWAGSEQGDADTHGRGEAPPTTDRNGNTFWPACAEGADETYKRQVLALAQERLKTLRDLPALTSYFFEEPIRDESLISENKQLKKLSADEIADLITAAHDALDQVSDWNAEAIQEALNRLLETTGQRPGVLFSLIRIYTTWAPFSPQLNDTLALLGKETTLARLKEA